MTAYGQPHPAASLKTFSRGASAVVVLLGCLVRVVSVWLLTLAITIICTGESSHAATAPNELTELSLEELMNIEVTSVSKKAERLSDAAASVYVITREDIRRSA